METVVLVMMMLVCFNYIMKQTYRKNTQLFVRRSYARSLWG